MSAVGEATTAGPDIDDRAEPRTEHVDVLVIGAGISGVSAAWHMRQQRPGTRFVVLDSKDTFGGTWITHRYPGIRSDSDLFTFGYRFKPWMGKPIATAEEILSYMGEVIEENDLARYIRYGHLVERANWSHDDAQWTVEGRRVGTGEPFRITAGFLWMCQGYYRHQGGYTPTWPGAETFGGRIVHPQDWPEDLDLADKRVVVIGSGATAATLVPAIAGRCVHVTMLQRSPTFFRCGRNTSELAEMLREIDIPDEWTHEIIRRKTLLEQGRFAQRSVDEPEAVKEELLAGVRAYVGKDFDIATHFTPKYRPWQQRIAFIPDGDLFQAVADGAASVVTDHIEAFDATGIRLASGAHLDADVIVTATGFNISVLGDIAFTVDGRPLDFSESTTWRGVMFTGLPNFAWVFGYFRWSWTLRSDLVAEFVCRLLDHMDARGVRRVVPQLRPQEADMTLLPWVEEEDFNPGYLKRSMHLLPKQGDRQPWRHTQDYSADKIDLPAADLDDGLRYD